MTKPIPKRLHPPQRFRTYAWHLMAASMALLALVAIPATRASAATPVNIPPADFPPPAPVMPPECLDIAPHQITEGEKSSGKLDDKSKLVLELTRQQLSGKSRTACPNHSGGNSK